MNLNNYLPFVQEFVTSFFVFILLAFIAFKFFKSFFPISIASERSALSHAPTLRGVGIVFPICLIISSFLFTQNYKLFNFYFLLIFISTLIGFYDDLKNINYVKKLLSLTFLFMIIVLIDNDVLLLLDINILFSIVISLTFFIFFVLFFNQIDGINGLSSGTFCIFLASLIFLKNDEIVSTGMFINILGIVFSYFLLNILQIKFFQGDSGAYFLGSTAYLIFQENEEILFISLVFLFPIIGDIIWTTIMRGYFRYNLSEPHKTHLYQKSVSKIKSHFPVTFCHILIQLACFFIIYYFQIYKEGLFIQLIFLTLFGLFFSLIYIYTSYLFNKNK